MPNLDSRINDIISNAAREIAVAVRQNIAEEVSKLVGATAAAPVAARQAKAAAAPKAKPGPKPARAKPGPKPQPKMASAPIDAVLAYIKANPGKRTEEISKALGADAKPGLAKLREKKTVKTKGERRATTYSVA